MFKKIVILLFLTALLSCHAKDEVVEPQREVSSGVIKKDEETESPVSDRMASTDQETEEMGELVEMDESEMEQMSNESEREVEVGEDTTEEEYGNALDVIKSSRAAYRCGTSSGVRRCRGRRFCCPRRAISCCSRDCCRRGFRRCDRFGFCMNRRGYGLCRIGGRDFVGNRCATTVCCPKITQFNRCGRFVLTGLRILTACSNRRGKVPCGTPPTAGTVCTNGRCCRLPLRCCAGGCCR